MAATKKKSTRKTTSKASSARKSNKKRQTKKQGVTTGFQTEIILLTILAICIILVISNLGVGGGVGTNISNASFGIMGFMAYFFPVFILVAAVFLVSNRNNPIAYKKALAALVFFIFLCGFIQLLTDGYMSGTTFEEYYTQSSTYKSGGGVIGGAICISCASAFGVAGGYVIIVLVLLVSFILITQKSFFGFVFYIWDNVCALARDGRDIYMEGQPERDLKKEIRTRERKEKREAKHAERMRELEEELKEQELAKKETIEQQSKNQKEEKHSGFLDGTLLVATETAAPKASTAKSKSKKSERKKSQVQPVTVEDVLQDTPNIVETTPLDIPEVTAPVVNDMEEIEEDTFEIHRAEPVIDEDDFNDEPMVASNDGVESTGEVYADDLEQEPGVTAAPKANTASSAPVRNPKSSKEEIESGIRNIQHEITQKNDEVKKEYHYPPLKLLKKGDSQSQGDSNEHLRKTARKLQDTLQSFGVKVTVTNVSCGPTVTRYELQPEQGVKVSRIVNLADDIKLNLATPDIRIEAPIPGKAAVGIEVPNKENHAVMLRDLLASQEFQSAKSKLSFAVGKDIAGKPVVADIAKMPHLLIAGATGSGKSVCINTLIVSILYKASPEDVKLIMIDPKVVELSVYNGIPHLFIPVVTDPKKAAGALNWAVTEMMSRYNTFAEFSVRNLQEYNRKVENMRIPEGEERPELMPQIVIIVDELADLMMVAPGEVEDAICRLAQLARAAGIHLIIATQRPSVNVITGLIKANMPSRVAFAVSSGVDSRTILDMNGAEKLLGKGDMLFYPQGYQKPARMQGAFVSDEEVSSIVAFLADKNPGTTYNAQIEQQVNTSSLSSGSASSGDDRDAYFVDAGKFIIEKEKASIGMLQRMFKIGFNRAARIMDQLCDAGVVGPEEGTKPRKVLMSAEEFENYIEEYL